MPEVFKTKLLKLLEHAEYKPIKLARLAKELEVGEDDKDEFKLAFDQLLAAGRVVISSSKLVSLPPLPKRITGTFRSNPKGFGFVIPQITNSHGDLFIPPNATAEAMTGDTVIAKVVRKERRGDQSRINGQIVEILERAHNRFVGTLQKTGQGWLVKPDGSVFTEPISVGDVSAKSAQPSDKVVVEIINYPTEKKLATGVIIKVLGKAGQYDTEIASVIYQFHLPEEFPENCINHAHKSAADFNPDALDGREDITNKTIITIDPDDAKDFDDAISLEKDKDSNWVLGIHIADVSTFIAPDSPLDVEAKSRGNSTYLPGKVIPMLPEVLSNGVCSLQPDQPRYTKSAYIIYNSEADIVSTRFANSLIRSTQRLNYRQADRALKGKDEGLKPQALKLLKDMDALARIIEKRRVKNGMLHLNLPETELIMDKSGRVVDAEPADTSYPHTIIEMFMVEANEAVAALLDRLNVPFMRRIHPEADVLSLQNLSKLLRSFGISLPKTPTRKDIQRLLDGIKGLPFSLPVNLMVLRSFEKAQYAPLNIGHYALASTHYCHFTSPIRRYADLLIHRTLNCYLTNTLKTGGKNILSEGELIETGKHITFAEQRSENAERELKTVLLLQMLSKHVGDELDCVVTGVTGFGIFAQYTKFGIEGLIQLADLGDDDWRFNPRTQSLEGARCGIRFHLGTPIKTKIISVNVTARQLSLAPAEPLTGEPKKAKKVKKYPRKRQGGNQRGRKKSKR
ncbi:MAG: ribonuclease R [Phycisphaerae bacterium]|nr:ribonuclease R [Phycisphaerae bacterium]